jgi:hypothetical protein
LITISDGNRLYYKFFAGLIKMLGGPDPALDETLFELFQPYFFVSGIRPVFGKQPS